MLYIGIKSFSSFSSEAITFKYFTSFMLVSSCNLIIHYFLPYTTKFIILSVFLRCILKCFKNNFF